MTNYKTLIHYPRVYMVKRKSQVDNRFSYLSQSFLTENYLCLGKIRENTISLLYMVRRLVYEKKLFDVKCLLWAGCAAH